MTTNEELAEKAYKLAYKYEAERGSCPQCVLAALKEILDIGDEATIKAGDALAGGAALSSKGTCGALAGGLLAISAMAGREYSAFSKGERKRRVFLYAKKLYDKFHEEYDSPLCCGVQTKLFGRSYVLCDLEEYKLFDEAGAHEDKCPSVAGNVAKWTAEIILNNLKK